MPSQVISHVKITDAHWAATPEIPLNSGLIAIIGPRGSGKTALADVIAAGCDAITPAAWAAEDNASPSFLARARQLICDATATLNWGSGTTSTRHLDGRDADEPMSFPRARYLSQQFVEELCSSNGISDSLVEEIERVIFESHQQAEADGAIDFAQLRDQRTVRVQQARERETNAIWDISERISTELEKENLVSTVATQVSQKTAVIANYNSDLTKLVVKGTDAQVKRHAELSVLAQDRRGRMLALSNHRRTFLAMQDEVRSMQTTRAPEMLLHAQPRHPGGGLDAKQWDEFLLVYKGDVDKSLIAYIAWADRQIADLNGVAPPPGDPNHSLIADDVDLGTLRLAAVAAEMARLETLFSADKLVRDQYSALTARIAQENVALKALNDRLLDAQGAGARRKQLQNERDDAYGRVFEAIINEQSALAGLYAPLMSRLAASSGTLRKLGFSVRRIANVEEWGGYAEENLLDRRKTGPFYGRGSLIALATDALKRAWENGTAADVHAAMTAFMANYLRDILSHAPYAPKQQAELRARSKQFPHCLFGTDHLSL